MEKQFQQYSIRVHGLLDKGWELIFESNLRVVFIEAEKGPVTSMTVSVRDSSELYGLISKFRDLGLTLLHLNRI